MFLSDVLPGEELNILFQFVLRAGRGVYHKKAHFYGNSVQPNNV